jgi:peptidoglycan/LPS O-acetylase OafA/YrhL
MQRIDQLTFTRFFAALIVVIFHYGNKAYPFNLPIISSLVAEGQVFVSYFFALSGFIMAIVYFRPENPIRPVQYWFFRFARIYPVYLLGLLLTMIFVPQMWQDFPAIRLNLALLQAWQPPYPTTLNYPGWSLSVEAFFYISFPFLLWISYRINLKLNAILIILFWLASQIGHAYLMDTVYIPGNVVYRDLFFYHPLVHMNTFLLGCLGGRWWIEYGAKITPAKWTNRIILLVSIALIVLAFLHLPDLFRNLSLPLRITLPNGILAPLFLTFTIALAYETGIIANIFRSSFFRLLGDASYAVYILQYPVHLIYKKYILPAIPNPTDTTSFYAYLIVLIVISVLVFRLFEAPLRDVAKSFYKQSPIAKRGW